MGATTLITGGAGYIGMLRRRGAARQPGSEVRVLDSLLHGQHDSRRRAARARASSCIVGDIRDADARAEALRGADAVVHLAAIVGDPACARDPEPPQAVNVDAAQALVADAARRRRRALRVRLDLLELRPHGRSRPSRSPRTARSRPSRSTPSRRSRSSRRCSALDPAPFAVTCLRFATVYGVAPRMRFDLTVNEFTRDLWADRALEVFGEQFWRPYVHVRDAARGVRAVLEAPADAVAGEVFNVGRHGENYRKLDLVEQIRRADRPRRGRVRAPRRGPARLQGRLRQGRASGSATRSR